MLISEIFPLMEKYMYIYSRAREFCIHLFYIIFRRIFYLCGHCDAGINFVSILHRYDGEDCRSVLDDENVISIHNRGR